jgi:tRNA(Ile)-lysidine synthase TilS/MesJ
MERYQEIERSIITKYRKELWSPFVRAIENYELINENDKVMVCISGGKDSFLLAKLIEEIIKHGKVKFEAKYVVMNPGYNELNQQKIIENSKILNVPIEIFESDIFQSVENVDFKSPCYMCARMRRGYLYSKAKELGCNKIALGHHMDDVIETTLLSMFYSSEVKTMMPKLHSDNFPGIELIRPMYMIREKDVISWAKYNGLEFINCACKFTQDSSIDESLSKRREMKKLIKEMSKTNKNVEVNIFTALDNINLNCVLGTKINGKYKSFLEDYDKIDNKEGE